MFNYGKYIKSILIILFSTLLLTSSNAFIDRATANNVSATVATQAEKTNIIMPLTIIASPKCYLNKTVTMNARFDKFSTLGLDYKPAMRSSEEYISFLILREDSKYEIPLSEMKLFLKRDIAEKNIELKTNDEIQIVGKVFSDALGDAWIDVEQLKVIKKAPDKNGVN